MYLGELKESIIHHVERLRLDIGLCQRASGSLDRGFRLVFRGKVATLNIIFCLDFRLFVVINVILTVILLHVMPNVQINSIDCDSDLPFLLYIMRSSCCKFCILLHVVAFC